MMFFKEPTLDDILNEDAIILLMARDGVHADDVRLLMKHVRQLYTSASPNDSRLALPPAEVVSIDTVRSPA
ncbi:MULTISPECIES: hypothetical protein [Asticcacaulis]|uniref:hypothetical protein n=1 Tax=Asticcacaulis TaxID=76890 RepID=UPI001AE26674|nr:MULTISPECIES: hypothetical protein [Asticcacaulis]MBP2159163.1 hypothetical protein [Asticcacaulis solisilvae]MDR6800208.1 hypothetical protein [Asticcacaulis sp. BE141]